MKKTFSQWYLQPSKGSISNKLIIGDLGLKGALPTIKYALDKDAKAIILMSHLGRPDGKRAEKESLKPVAEELKRLLGKYVTFLNDCVGEEVERVVEGSVEDKQGNKTKAGKDATNKFRASLSKFGDIFMMLLEQLCAHSSIVGVKLDQRAAGYLMKKELDYFGLVLENPERRFLAILVGIKKAKTIVWNDSMEVFEQDQFANRTQELLKAVVKQTKQNTITIIGGEDTATASAKFVFADQVNHVSTGGGASLELLEGKDLPGVTGLSDK
ncbi:unnamed protein product [Rotaria socialis]|uniref:Phosphoglycerate kinase n=2 Tax=Rotaria socialis TaxID=392032 RepID=A0A820M3A5_9BILA|nr:unnamed protein product [Rotaria socialis]CAF4695080.1 unnamed protein product [Rotaria socialis]